MANPTVSTSMEEDQENKLKERDNEIVKIFMLVGIIIDQLGKEKTNIINSEITNGIVDIDTSDEISGVLMTVYTCLRKEANDPAGHLKYKSYYATVDKVEVSISSVVDEVKKRKLEINFLIATPIVELMTLFNSSYNEVRTGVTRFRVRDTIAKKTVKRDATGRVLPTKDKAKESTHNITQYGANYHHVPLLQGITFAPERRTGVIRSLGPLTQAIMLVLEDNYHNELQSALMNSLQMLPMAGVIVNCLKDASTPGRYTPGIIKELGDILILTTARSTQKVNFPLILYFILWRAKQDTLTWSFSGAKMMKYYNESIDNFGLKFRIRSGADKIKTSQAVFHAIFGTYLNDLEICEQITMNTGKWFQRKEMNQVFIKRGDAGKIEFTPIKFKYVSKMAQALLTKSLGNVEPVATSRPSFSGFRKRSFTSEFINYLRFGRLNQSYSSDPVQLLYALRKTKDQILKDIETVKLLQSGTTEWEEYRDGAWVATDFIASEGNKKFFGA